MHTSGNINLSMWKELYIWNKGKNLNKRSKFSLFSVQNVMIQTYSSSIFSILRDNFSTSFWCPFFRPSILTKRIANLIWDTNKMHCNSKYLINLLSQDQGKNCTLKQQKFFKCKSLSLIKETNLNKLPLYMKNESKAHQNAPKPLTALPVQDQFAVYELLPASEDKLLPSKYA